MADIFDLFKKIASSAPAERGPVSFLVAGLGNPGTEYRDTRHNAGFWALDALAAQMGVTVDRARFRSLVGEGMLEGVRVLLMKPETFMNASGTAIAEAASFYKIPPERVVVLCDDISFAPGVIRIRRRGSAGGHNGLKSVIECLGSQDFLRVKIGVGEKPRADYPLADWVLGRLGAEERAAVNARLADITAAVSLLAKGEVDTAMNQYPK
ncbi:MAG: aminoacyl-tRNA hydrolase [Clostridia bacterium]|nr:aminoacyl-tRNA hydrolase [Clostridia bacterium]